MAAIPTFRTLRPHLNLAAMPTDAVLPFLVPSAQCLRAAPVSRFSTTPSRCKGKREKNKLRGVSPVRGTGLQKRQVLSVTAATGYDKMKLAKPTKPVTEVQGDPNHGLWDFFKDKKLLQTPVDEAAHGREWTVSELRPREWEVLHKLWWVCVKERNRLATEKITRQRVQAGYGDLENNERDKVIQKSMKAIIDVLVERNNAYNEAYQLAQTDPEIDLNKLANQYQPPSSELPYDAEEIDDEAALNEGLEDPAGAVPQGLKQPAAQQETTTIDIPATPKEPTNKV